MDGWFHMHMTCMDFLLFFLNTYILMADKNSFPFSFFFYIYILGWRDAKKIHSHQPQGLVRRSKFIGTNFVF